MEVTTQYVEVVQEPHLETIITKDVTNLTETILEDIPAIAPKNPEHISTSIPQVEVTVSAKSKKSKTSSKSGHGFSKPKSPK